MYLPLKMSVAARIIPGHNISLCIVYPIQLLLSLGPAAVNPEEKKRVTQIVLSVLLT